jgi:hypothetical protein
VHDLQGNGQGFPAAAQALVLLSFYLAIYGLGAFAEMRTPGQVLAFFDHLGGEGYTGGLAAVAAVGAGQKLEQSQNGVSH